MAKLDFWDFNSDFWVLRTIQIKSSTYHFTELFILPGWLQRSFFSHRKATCNPINDKIRQRTFVAKWLDDKLILHREFFCRTDFENTINWKTLKHVTGDVSGNLERFQLHLKKKRRAKKGKILLLLKKID